MLFVLPARTAMDLQACAIHDQRGGATGLWPFVHDREVNRPPR